MATSDKRSKEVEVVVDRMHADEDDYVGGTEGEDGRGGESAAWLLMVDWVGHLAMDWAIVFATEARVCSDVGVGEVCPSTWDKAAIISVLPEEKVVGGRDASGHDGSWSSRARVLILEGCD